MNGKHLILDLYGCDPELLDDFEYLRTTLCRAVEQTEATIIDRVGHKFEPQGVTALLLLAESHASIHTWPTEGYAAVDIYTCNAQNPVQNIVNYLVAKLKSTSYHMTSLDRIIKHPGVIDDETEGNS